MSKVISSLELMLAKFSKVPLLEGPTPIQYLARLSKQLGKGVDIFVKRDDFLGLGGGGNKLRKLEFLIGEAVASDADTILTVGARQSNHARLTAAVAARVGMNCELVLARLVPRNDEDYENNGNVLLDNLLGAHIHELAGTENPLKFAEERAAALRTEGRTVYVCPLGGSSPIGCLGYVNCAVEIGKQIGELGYTFDHIVIPNGSGGMQAGLVAGFVAMGQNVPLINGYTVYSPSSQARENTRNKVNQVLQLINPTLSVDDKHILIDGSQLGDGYGIPTKEMCEAVRLLARTEGLFLDPVYGGKAFAGLLQHINTGVYRAGQRILFLMTGGIPGLFAYRRAFETIFC
jgi:D-cysteine desulfhydrase